MPYRSQSLKHRTAGCVASDLTEADVVDIAESVVKKARATRQPNKSLAAQEREALAGDADPALLKIVLDSARDLLGAQEVNPPPVRETGEWLSPLNASARLAVPVTWVTDRLQTPDGRRLLGYPWFDGRRWHIPSAACDSLTRSIFLAQLPRAEPPENVELLSDVP